MSPDLETQEIRDTSRWWWWGLLGLFVVLVLMLYIQGPAERTQSEVKARHILIKADLSDPASRQRAIERLEEIKQRIAAGESFAELAREYSEDPYSAERGGDLGWAPKDTYQGDFEEYVWNGPVGKVSDVIRTGHGYHLVLIEDRYLTEVDAHIREEQQKTFEERMGQ